MGWTQGDFDIIFIINQQLYQAVQMCGQHSSCCTVEINSFQISTEL